MKKRSYKLSRRKERRQYPSIATAESLLYVARYFISNNQFKPSHYLIDGKLVKA